MSQFSRNVPFDYAAYLLADENSVSVKVAVYSGTDIDETITALKNICNFSIIKTMRDSFSKKNDYEIVAEIVAK